MDPVISVGYLICGSSFKEPLIGWEAWGPAAPHGGEQAGLSQQSSSVSSTKLEKRLDSQGTVPVLQAQEPAASQDRQLLMEEGSCCPASMWLGTPLCRIPPPEPCSCFPADCPSHSLPTSPCPSITACCFIAVPVSLQSSTLPDVRLWLFPPPSSFPEHDPSAFQSLPCSQPFPSAGQPCPTSSPLLFLIPPACASQAYQCSPASSAAKLISSLQRLRNN